MNFDEIKINNRLQIESENTDHTLRNVKGIVLGVSAHSVILVTDFGQLVEIDEDKILSITKITFDKIVSDALTDLKNHFNDIYELEMKLKYIKENEQTLRDKLFDANFLAKFNIKGAKNRLDNSIDKELLSFEKELIYKISFDSNPNSEIEIFIQVFNNFEYYNLNPGEVDKIIRTHAPNIKDVIEKCFAFQSDIEEIEKKVVHEKDSMYSVCTLYRLKVEVTEVTFLSIREEIIKGLMKLKK
ncbi:hypothetical protein PP175_26560 (plasmid) [Aneurinibacillus sp. Ricciae_BoGa-3]|uniref:hypothetical protein n=1 Tax=Aneurinibacillus sp. Ricciae_BoGa-3 TaxID=3022697 RepID=UPI002341A669|nr:hypothetical protein [Aneurinibacillus sp. Ricciae_BoGa-3]WCK57628.1 hypothetical protein PP175_26560 [Aneurinibacillus sp. Ricciae_BoGa-3]